MTNYTIESCHEIGYGWQIEAPEGLTADDIETLADALIDYTDTPSQEQLDAMLLSESVQIDIEKLELFKQVKISVDTVHRNSFTQDLEGEKA